MNSINKVEKEKLNYKKIYGVKENLQRSLEETLSFDVREKKWLFNKSINSKYPFTYKFIKEYFIYNEILNYMFNIEFTDKSNEYQQYKSSLIDNVLLHKRNLYSNVELLNEILKIENIDKNPSITEESGVTNLIYNIACSISIINFLKIKDFDIKLSTLILELDQLTLPLTIHDCKLIKTSFQIVCENELKII